MKPPKPLSIAAIKREQAALKRAIVDRVTSAAMHILYDSHLAQTTLWPKNGMLTPANPNHEMKDVIEVRPIIHGMPDGTLNQYLRLNMFNKSYARVIKQQKALEPILDQAIYDNIHFTHTDSSSCGMGLDRTMGMMDFKFTIND